MYPLLVNKNSRFLTRIFKIREFVDGPLLFITLVKRYPDWEGEETRTVKEVIKILKTF